MGHRRSNSKCDSPYHALDSFQMYSSRALDRTGRLSVG